MFKNISTITEKNRIEKKKKEWDSFLKESNWLRRSLDLNSNNLYPTEIVLSDYKKYLSDNKKNIDLMVETLNIKGSLSLFEAPTGTGKTYISNTVLNILRENKKKEVESFLNGITLTNKDDLDKIKVIEERTVEDIRNRNAIKIHNISKKKSTRLTDSDLDFVNRINDEIKASKDKIRKDYIEKNFKKVLVDDFSDIQEINDYVEENGVYVLSIILCPNRIQNIQNQEEDDYDYKAIIGDGKNQIEVSADTNYSMVYDKIYELLSLIDDTATVNIKLIVDEAHNLIKDAAFRVNAIEGIIKCVDKVLSLNGSVAFMTATPDSLSYFKFNRILSFIPEEEKSNYDKAVLYVNKKTSDNMLQYTYKVAKSIENPIVRINSLKGIEKLDFLFKKDGFTGYTLTSKDKEVNLDGTYKNEMFGKIVKESVLPDAQYYLCTQLLEAGTNIKGIKLADETVEERNISPVYAIHDSRNCNFDSIEQFIARRRYTVKGSTVNITIPDSENKAVIYSKGQIFAMQKDKLYTSLKTFRAFFDAAKICYDNKEQLIENINRIIDSQVYIDGTKLSMNCIFLDEETMTIKYNKLIFWKCVYEKWMEQFFYNYEEFAKEIEEKLNLPVEIIEGSVSNDIVDLKEIKDKAKLDKMEAIAITVSLKKDEIEVLEKVLKHEVRTQDIKEKVVKERLEKILDIDSLKRVLRRAIAMEISINEVVNVMRNVSRKHNAQLLLKSLSSEDLDSLDKIRRKEISIESIDKSLAFIFNEILCVYYDDFRIRREISTINIVERILSKKIGSEDKEVEEYLLEEQFIKNNIMYIEQTKEIPSYEQKVILNALFELDSNYKQKQKRVSQQTIKKLTDILNTNYRGKKYSEKSVLNIIEHTFNLNRDSKGIIIWSIKTEH